MCLARTAAHVIEANNKCGGVSSKGGRTFPTCGRLLSLVAVLLLLLLVIVPVCVGSVAWKYHECVPQMARKCLTFEARKPQLG